jgi:two-component system LytT family sensor kinase
MRIVPQKVNRYNEVIPVLVWTLIFVLPFLLRIILFRNDPRNGSLADIFFSFLTIIAVFYLHTYLVYPLLTRRYGRWLYSLALLGCLIFFLGSMRYFMRDLSGVAEAHGLPGGADKQNLIRIALIFPFALIIFCSFSYRVYIEKIRQSERIKEMETAHLKTELDFLRSQISPHFMFNLMNTLVSMARKKSDLMEPSLMRLSQLMRYMLYDSSSEKVQLGDETEYLKSYINLQLLRFGDVVRFNLFLSGDPQGYKIAPMLLIPFVENAFKHGTVLVEEPMIEVSMDIYRETNTLAFKVINNVSQAKIKAVSASGIGLANVRRRLSLLYPNRHTMVVEEKDELFSVYLTIKL